MNTMVRPMGVGGIHASRFSMQSVSTSVTWSHEQTEVEGAVAEKAASQSLLTDVEDENPRTDTMEQTWQTGLPLYGTFQFEVTMAQSEWNGPICGGGCQNGTTAMANDWQWDQQPDWRLEDALFQTTLALYDALTTLTSDTENMGWMMPGIALKGEADALGGEANVTPSDMPEQGSVTSAPVEPSTTPWSSPFQALAVRFLNILTTALESLPSAPGVPAEAARAA
jgi:hypothetical protein